MDAKPLMYQVAYRKKVGDREYTPTIGIAFGKERHIEVRLDALPLQPWDGVLILFPRPAEDA